jgi:hypothetical protein
VRVQDLTEKVVFVCHAQYEGGVHGLCLCIVATEPDENGDFLCYTYKSQYPNDDPKWVTGRHYPPKGGERVKEPVNASNVMVIVPKLLKSRKFQKTVLSAIKTHPAYHRVGKKSADSSEDDEPLGIRAGVSRSVIA